MIREIKVAKGRDENEEHVVWPSINRERGKTSIIVSKSSLRRIKESGGKNANKGKGIKSTKQGRAKGGGRKESVALDACELEGNPERDTL